MQEKISLKDKHYLDLLKSDPELEGQIADAMTKLDEHGLSVPVFHITSRAVRLPDGGESSTGYLENIAQNGLRANDTNVAALMERGPDAHIAPPSYFKNHPHKFLRAIATSLQHYGHHGSRTNKASLDDRRDQGKGVPVMLVIDPTDVLLIPGTDYDDHFMLGEPVDSSRIIGAIELSGRRPIDPNDVAQVAKEYALAIEAGVSEVAIK